MGKHRERHCILYPYKILHGQTPAFLSELLPGYVFVKRGPYNLCNSLDINSVPSPINVLYNSFFPRTSRIWNNRPQHLRNIHDSNVLKDEYLQDCPKENLLYFMVIERRVFSVQELEWAAVL